MIYEVVSSTGDAHQGPRREDSHPTNGVAESMGDPMRAVEQKPDI